MEAKAKAQQKIRKILLIGISTTIYGILVNYLVDDFEVFLKAGFMVFIIDATALFTICFIHKKIKKREEQEEKNKKFNP